jgi:hypothetical protein
MAAFFGKKLVLPIGCSCIQQIQLQRSTRLLPLGRSVYFFDWAGVPPDDTVKILNQRRPIVEKDSDLELVHGKVRARAMKGVYFWHIKPFLGVPDTKPIVDLTDHPQGVQRFLDHHRFIMKKLNDEVGEIHCLWTNIQPNLQDDVRRVRGAWADFLLTVDRYASIKDACSRLPAKKITTWFVCRKEDMDASLTGKDDVIVMDVPRSPTDFRGEVGLFDPVFEKMGICRPAVPGDAVRTAADGGAAAPEPASRTGA